MYKATTALFIAVVLLLQGCASSLTGDTYSQREARRVQNVEFGWIETVTPVVIEGRTESPLGAGAGGDHWWPCWQ